MARHQVENHFEQFGVVTPGQDSQNEDLTAVIVPACPGGSAMHCRGKMGQT